MPNLQRFEGATPAEARARARQALGPDAAIVRAGRERSGGLFGFFEREVFVLEVEATRSGDGAHDGGGPGGTAHDGAAHDRAAYGGTAHDRAAYGGTAHDRAAHDGAAHDGAASSALDRLVGSR